MSKIWVNLGKIKMLHPQKYSISYGYDHCELTISAVIFNNEAFQHSRDLLQYNKLARFQ